MKSLLSASDKEQTTLAIGKELYASALYKDLSNKLQSQGYFGASKYFLKESEDELKHYQMWADFCNSRIDVAEIPSVPAMKNVIDGLYTAFSLALKTEIDLGKFYETFYDNTEDCFVAQRLLGFLEIQRTSVGELSDFIARLDICGSDRAALLQFDKELS